MITQRVCNPFPNFYIAKLDNLVQNILSVAAQHILTVHNSPDQAAYQIWPLIKLNYSGTVKFFITFEDFMENDCGEICRGLWTSQREMMRLTAQQYFPANFLSRQTNFSISITKHKYKYCYFYQNRHQIFKFHNEFTSNYQARCTVTGESRKKMR